MKGIGIKWNKSIFTRLTATFLFALVPIYILGTSIYKGGELTIRDEISKSMTSQVNYYLDNFEEDIERAEGLLYALINDDDLNRLASAFESMDIAESTAAINRVRESLTAIKDSSSYIKDARVHIPSLDKTISSVNSLAVMPDEEYNALKNLRSDSESQIVYWENRLFFSITHPLYFHNNERMPLYLLVMELDNKEFGNALQQFKNYIDGGAFLFSLSSDFTATSDLSIETSANIHKLTLNKIKNADTGTFLSEINGKSYLTIYSKSNYFNMVLSMYIPVNEVYKPLKKYQIWFLIFSIVSVIIVFAYSFSTLKVIHRPLLNLVNSFKEMENGDLGIKIKHKRDDEFGYLYTRFNAMVENLNILIEQVYKQKIMAQRAQLKHLQSQINPHFLYNSFFSLDSMLIKGDYDGAEQFTRQLGSYFKFITRNAADEITLEKETEYARAYAEIQAGRFRNRIRVEFGELPEICRNFIVPRLIIQPVIENAFEHGLKNKVSDGLVRIGFSFDTDKLCIYVEDNGDEAGDSEIERIRSYLYDDNNDMESTGIINIHKRIRLKYGPESGLFVSRGELEGFRAEIRIFTGKVNSNVQVTDSR